jgi:hypothetical protein
MNFRKTRPKAQPFFAKKNIQLSQRKKEAKTFYLLL